MIKETKNGLKILVGTNGQESLFINSERIDDCINYLHNNDLRYITINSFQDYYSKDIAFLSQLKDFLEGLSILDTHYDYSIVNELHKLKYLSIPDNGRDVINLKNFPEIETCGITYSSRLIGLESCNNLKCLAISDYKPKVKDLTALPVLKKLVQLKLIKSNITSLQGIESFINLKKLEVFSATKLESIEALTFLSKSLEEIELDRCKKVHHYEILGEVDSLKKIILTDSGDIKSLAFVKRLTHLEFISFWGTNVLDGNIQHCQGINYVGFDNKKHYTLNSSDFKRNN